MGTMNVDNYFVEENNVLIVDGNKAIIEYGTDQGKNKEDLKKYINKSAEKYNIEKNI